MLLGIIPSFVFAASLCADCLAVCICSSVKLERIDWSNVGAIAVIFGVIQSGLLLLGYLFGDLFLGFVESFAHLIGFLLLLYVGGSMVYESLKKDCEIRDLSGFTATVLSAVATSIDALVVGVSLSMAQLEAVDVFHKSLAVFLMTALSVIIGIFFGQKLGHKFGKVAECIGGIVLVFIGFNILFGIF